MLNSLKEIVTIAKLHCPAVVRIIQWAVPFNRIPPMGDSAICLPWDKNFGLTPLVVYVGIYKRVQRSRSKSLPPGTDTEKLWGTLIKWDSTMEPFVLPKQPLLLTVGRV